MFIRLMMMVARVLLWLRYRVRLRGLKEIRAGGDKGILFLPNHPALIDPIILVSQLYGHFKVRALADRDQIDRFLIRRIAKGINVLAIPASSKLDAAGEKEIRQAIQQCVEALRGGDNLILYPAGQTYLRRFEDLAGGSAVESILAQYPDVRVVLVRTRGLWGSEFSRASRDSGRGMPSVAAVLGRGVRSLLLSGIFFAPRRQVSVEFVEPDDMPRTADRLTINRYLEQFYNQDAPPNTYVPHTIWERGVTREVPEPTDESPPGDLGAIPPATREIVSKFLREISGHQNFDDDSRLSHDLGMDSLTGIQLVDFLQEEFGFARANVDSLQTVGDVMLSAFGQSSDLSAALANTGKIPRKWFRCVAKPERPAKLTEMTIGQAFLTQASRWPGKSAVADQASGVKTYRDLVLAIMLLKEQIKNLQKIPSERVGIMMPASVGAVVVYLATLFSGKTPAMINWTLGRKNLLHCLEVAGVERVITARAVAERIRSQGIDLDALEGRLIYIEDITAAIGTWAKLKALVAARCCWASLRKAEQRMSPVAAVLFTSGSESVPKAVPLTHRNMLTNVHDAYERFTLADTDVVLGILPPFHSFGLTASILLPLCLGLRAVYYPSPTDGGAIAGIIDAYKVTIPIATPTFLRGVVRASMPGQLDSVRLAVSGAEKCPASLYELLANRCPQATVLEGYGVTECSPIIAVNHQDDARAGTIGRVVSSLEYVIVDPQTNQRVGVGTRGMLLVRGESVFAGYLIMGTDVLIQDSGGYNTSVPVFREGKNPFVQFDGRRWYRTGDLVIEDADKVLTFAGRLRRFVKLGGEMVSLPAIESVLESRHSHDQGPVLAVVADGEDDRPEIVMFTTTDVSRESANRTIRDAGLSGLHNVRRIVTIEELPLLGTGKIDYLALEAILKKQKN